MCGQLSLLVEICKLEMSEYASRLEPVDPKKFERKYGKFDGKSVEDRWRGREKLRLVDQAEEITSFLSLASGVLVCTEGTLEECSDESVKGGNLGRLLYYGAECLRAVEVDSGTNLAVFNYNMISNCLDRKSSMFRRAPGEPPVKGSDQGFGVSKVAVFANLVGGATLFRIPQDRMVLAACNEKGRAACDEFYRTVKGSQWSKYFNFSKWGSGE